MVSAALLGGKGANLAEMTRIGLPVPPFFTVTTEACNAYLAAGQKFPEGMWDQMMACPKGSRRRLLAKKFGDPTNPLLVSCRSGAKFSMPGMMDTVLNIGLNDETVEGMVALTGNERFVYDSYRRLIQMFGSVVLDMPDEAFEDVLEEFKQEKGAKADTDLTAEDLKELVAKFKAVVKKTQGFDFPQNPLNSSSWQLKPSSNPGMASALLITAAPTNIPDDLGTAVNIVTMVFGNMGWDSGTGVAFTRNPATGENKMYGDYLLNAQGEDVVAGIRNTDPIEHMGETLPEAYKQFMEITPNP